MGKMDTDVLHCFLIYSVVFPKDLITLTGTYDCHSAVKDRFMLPLIYFEIIKG